MTMQNKGHAYSKSERCEENSSCTVNSKRFLKENLVWPDSNYFFKQGILSLVEDEQHNALSNGFIFVDFSSYNLKLLSKNDWICSIATKDCQVILIADKRMEALASYWNDMLSNIKGVIYSDDSHIVIFKKIRYAFHGRRYIEKKRKALSLLELKVLNLIVSGFSVKSIALKLDMKEKRVYAIKSILRAKMGGRINYLIAG
ncbi:helix-turn-helix transcriptional regulator [Klebsiella sp. S69]|uniref:helix-turn-helix transcriptional regulator n=1 Tax=Klebsiella sp. S69 TaxID=2767439 RepID=UPI001903EBEF|nr:LuxR C-terminal-related transcriptional regulator [Klebsiella sp. S69]MBK0167382.1 hypothetical protein [Klebsiella sp. S69]